MTHDPLNRDRELWRAVIRQAVMDAALSDVRKVKDRDEALAWIFEENEGFLEVCENAEVAPQHVRKLALQKIEELKQGKCKPKVIRRRRNNILLTYNGETLTVPEWARRRGISDPSIMHQRRRLGWSDEEIITTPVIPGQKRLRRGVGKNFGQSTGTGAGSHARDLPEIGNLNS